jgi:DNA-binding MarR family transcriptional regulator
MMTSKVLQTLAERGLVSKEPDPADARVKRLSLTEQGRTLVTRGIRIAVDLDEELFGQSGDPLRNNLRHIAERATANAKAKANAKAALPPGHGADN